MHILITMNSQPIQWVRDHKNTLAPRCWATLVLCASARRALEGLDDAMADQDIVKVR